jgi:choline dehydrogenase-like flavoprotein
MSSPIFDYLIVGGGTAGLVVAARLTEDAATSVCVLEAGLDISHEQSVQIPGPSRCLTIIPSLFILVVQDIISITLANQRPIGRS